MKHQLKSYFKIEENQLFLIDFFSFNNELKIKNFSLDEIFIMIRNNINLPYLNNSLLIKKNKLLFITTKSNIKNLFFNSFTGKELKNKLIENNLNKFSFLFINKLDIKKEDFISKKIFLTAYNQIEKANRWFETIVNDVKTNVVFNELFTNAYEHGNLGISSNLKNKLIKEDKYVNTLKDLEKDCNKKIVINIYKYDNYILTQITDEGEGFNIDSINFDNKKFNGRGIYLAKKYSLGIYYNEKGNSVIFVNKIRNNPI